MKTPSSIIRPTVHLDAEYNESFNRKKDMYIIEYHYDSHTDNLSILDVYKRDDSDPDVFKLYFDLVFNLDIAQAVRKAERLGAEYDVNVWG